MPNFNLLKELEERSNKNQTLYQTYDIKLGFEMVKVYIPYDKSELFEHVISEYTGVSSFDVQKIAETFNGYIKE